MPDQGVAGNRHIGSGDLYGIAAVLAATVVAAWHLLRGGTLTGEDALAFFFPYYGHLGERLAAFDLPGWSQTQLSGAPFLADPQSGWGYLPAMLFFTLLPLEAAARTLLLFHLLLAALASYALARAVGIGVVGAVAAGVAYEHASLVYLRASCCVVHTTVAAWLPLLLLGAELAVRARTWRGRLCWWGIGALALSQILAGWIGQGSYYSMLTLAVFLGVRGLLVPAPGVPRPLLPRLGLLALHGGAIVGWGFALAASGLLARLSYTSRTFLAGGNYGGPASREAVIGGWLPSQATEAMLDRGAFYVGAAALAVALFAVLARGRFGTPAFALLGVLLFLVTAPAADPNLLQRVLYAVLPEFESINRHFPHRVTLVIAIVPALLAAAGVQTLSERRPRRGVALVAIALPLLVGLLRYRGVEIPRGSLIAAGAAGVVAAAVVIPITMTRRVVPLLLILVILLDFHLVNRAFMAPENDYHRLDLDAYYDPGPAGRFLQEARRSGEPGRFFGYDPAIHPPRDFRPPLYRYHFAEAGAMALMVNNRSMTMGLEDIQGYNPVQGRRYVELLSSINGFAQEYREANIYASGLASPLLNLLNPRYIVIPAVVPATRADLQALLVRNRVVYRDERVQIMLNPAALPRAWIVHRAERVPPGSALPLLLGGTIDPRQVALLETAPPPLSLSADVAAELASVTENENDSLRIETRTDAPGLLMLSEIYDPGWSASIDGESADVLLADHVLRAIAIPAGEHTVELSYTPPRLRLGLTITGLALIGLVAAVIRQLGDWHPRWRRPRRSTTPSPSG